MSRTLAARLLLVATSSASVSCCQSCASSRISKTAGRNMLRVTVHVSPSRPILDEEWELIVANHKLVFDAEQILQVSTFDCHVGLGIRGLLASFAQGCKAVQSQTQHLGAFTLFATSPNTLAQHIRRTENIRRAVWPICKVRIHSILNAIPPSRSISHTRHFHSSRASHHFCQHTFFHNTVSCYINYDV